LATTDEQGKISLAAFDESTPKTQQQMQRPRSYFYRSQVIAHFVPIFVAMATKESLGEI